MSCIAVRNTVAKNEKRSLLLEDIWFLVIILIFFKPGIVDDLPFLDLVFNAGRFGLAFTYICRMLVVKKRINKDWLLLLAMSTIVLTSTVLIGKAYPKALTHYVPSLGMLAFFSLNSKKIDHLLVVVENLGIVLLVTNLITVLIFPEGLIYRHSNNLKIWILGQKQDIGGFIFPLLYIALCLMQNSKKQAYKFWIILIISCISAILEQPLGTLICLSIFLFLCFFDQFVLKLNINILVGVLIATFLITQYCCFNFENMIWLQELLSAINLKGVSKLRTINVRFGMWRFAWDMIAKYPIIGVGKLTMENWNLMTDVGYHSILDNMFMDVLFTGGIVTFSLFSVLIARSFNMVRKVWKYKIGRQMGYCLFALCILFLEGCPYYPFVFFVLLSSIWFPDLVGGRLCGADDGRK